MAYYKPTLYTPDWKRIRNMINGYQSGYRPVSRPRDYSVYNYDASLMPAETLPIPEEEYVPPVESASLPQGETSLDSLVYDNDKSLDKFKGGNTGSGMSKNPMAYLQAAGDLASMGMDIYNYSKSQVALPAYTNYHAGNVNSMAGYNMMRQGPMLSHNLAHKQTAGEVVGDTLTKTAKGALDGLSVGGPWGALAGAVIGLGMGIGNAATKGATYRKDIAKINYFNDVQRDNYRRAQRQALDNIQAQRNMGINYQRHMNTYGLGGTVEPSELMQVTQFNTGGTHEGNPYGGVPIGVGENGKPNLVEEGEVRWKDFIFSKRVKPTDEVLKKYNTYMKGGFESYADLANKILKLHKEREDSPFDKAAINTQMQRLADAQEWQKMADEAAENGMTPEEYSEYLQYAQQGQQFADGGETGDWRDRRKMRNRKGEDGMPVHGAGTKAYYDANKSGNAWYIEKYLDALYGRMSGGAGFMWDKDGNRISYNDSDLNRYGAKVSEILQKDPDAVYYMYNRISEINNEFGNGQPIGTTAIPNVYDMGFVMDSLGNPAVAWDGSKYYIPTGGEMSTTPYASTYTGGPYGGLNVAPPMDKSVFGVNQAGTNTMRNTIEAEIEAYKQRMANNSYAKGGPYKSANNYQGDTWVNYLKYRDTIPGSVEAFTEAYNKANGTKYSSETILKNLKDNKWGSITDAFLKYANDLSAQSTAATETNVNTNGQPPVVKTATATTLMPNNEASDVMLQYKVGNSLGLSRYDGMRLAPVFDSLRSVLEQNAPDYTYAGQLASLYRPISYRPVGQYARFRPIDQHYLDTMERQRQNTLYGYYRQNAISPAAANYYATLAATIGGSQAAQAYRDSVLQNNQNRNSVLAMNNQIEAARARTQQINYQNYANIMAQSYAAAEQERLAVEQAREANKQNLAANIGQVGRELSDRYYVSKNPALFYGPIGAYYKYIQEQNKKR